MNYLKILGLTFIIVLTTALSGQSQSQDKVEVRADTTKYIRQKGKGITKKLYGNVIYTFKRRNAFIYCDSSYQLLKEGLLKCFSNIKIKEGDSITITSKHLVYYQHQRLAQLRRQVVMDNKKTVLYTDSLNYSVRNSQAEYWGGGRIIDDTNELRSETGLYNTRLKKAHAGGNVIFKNPTYTLETDSLIYDLVSKQVQTIGYTKIIDSTSVAIAPEGAVYNANIKTITALPATFSTDNYEGRADRVYFDQLNKIYIGKGNVELFSKKDSILITGGHANMNKLAGEIMVYDHPLMRKIMQKDTFYLKADTLVSIDIPEKNQKELRAFHNVLIYKSDLQGVADSLAYHVNDSLIYLFTNPVLWSQENQITADNMQIGMGKKGVKYMDMQTNSFVVMQDSLKNFNQLKGRDMHITFSNGKLKTMNVNGNSESIFFSVDEKTGLLLGMNRLICSDMRIVFDKGKASAVTFKPKPDGVFTPPHELKKSDKYLQNFKWREEQRPYLRNNVPVNKQASKNGKAEKPKKKMVNLPLKKPKLRELKPLKSKE
ncbi:MAG: hypothetical protein MI784_14270 [Cytophagales bacterium]|nr:hypothetical protein [Cytophagales bacterium]